MIHCAYNEKSIYQFINTRIDKFRTNHASRNGNDFSFLNMMNLKKNHQCFHEKCLFQYKFHIYHFYIEHWVLLFQSKNGVAITIPYSFSTDKLNTTHAQNISITFDFYYLHIKFMKYL